MITSFKDTCYIEILPKVEKSKRGKRFDFDILITLLSFSKFYDDVLQISGDCVDKFFWSINHCLWLHKILT